MAIEISEGAAAAAMLLTRNELTKLYDKTLISAVTKIHKIIKDPKKINMSPLERTQYSDWFDPSTLDKTIAKANKDAKLTAIVHGYSAALAVKEWFLSSQHRVLPLITFLS